MSSWFDGNTINLLVAYIAGVSTFFASCLVPLVPTYLAYLSGVALTDGEGEKQRWLLVRVSLSFVLGFVASFVALGALSNRFAAVLVPYRVAMQRIIGVIFVGLGMVMIGWLRPTWIVKERRLQLGSWFQHSRYVHAFITGLGFGFGWTPCIGPVLGVLLLWSGHQETMGQGIVLLTVYGLGLGTPFVITAALFDKVTPLLKKSARLSREIELVSAVMIILAGGLLFTGQLQRMSLFLLHVLQLDSFSR